MISFSPFLLIGTKFAFFQRLENVFSNLQFLNMIESGFTKFLANSFDIFMETSSCLWTLLILSVLIIFHISQSSISKDDNFVSVTQV